MKKLLKVLAFIVITPILILGLTIASCSVSDYLKEAQENQKPLLKAMKDWAVAHPNPDHDTSPTVLKFIPLQTPKTKALNILTQNGFKSEISESDKSQQMIRAIYTRSGTACRYDYEILLELKAEKVTKTSGNISQTCL